MRELLRLIIAVVLQVFLFNMLQFMGICHPYPYIVCLMMMPITRPLAVDMLYGAALGLTIDLFSNCLGVHMAACVAICYLRRWAIPHLVFEPERLRGEISPATLGNNAYFQIMALLVTVHHLIVFLLGAWNLSLIGWTLLETLVSGLLTFVLITFYNLVEQQNDRSSNDKRPSL